MIVEGLIHERRGTYADALRAFQRAQVLTPKDRGLAELMSFPILQRWAELGDVNSALTFASLMVAQGRVEKASFSLSRAADVVQKAEGLPAIHRQRLLDRIEQFRTQLH